MPALLPRKRKIPTAVLDTVSYEDCLGNTSLIKCFTCDLQPVGVGQQCPVFVWATSMFYYSLPPLQGAKLHHEVCTVL